MALKNLSELQLFKVFIKNNNKIIDDMSNELLFSEYRITEDMIKEQLSIIERRFKYTSKNKILLDFAESNTVPVFNIKLSVPSMIPTWLILKGNDISAICNLTLYAKDLDKNEKLLDIDNKKLYGLLQSGTILLGLFKNQNKITNNIIMIKNSTYIYTRMLVRCLDRAYSLNYNKTIADKVAYLIAKFFQIYIMGRTDNETTKGIAFSCISNDTSKNALNQLDEEFDCDFLDFNEFIEELSKTFEELRHLSLRVLVENWIRMYGDSTLFALESYYYFLITIFFTFIMTGLNNEVVINNLASKEINAAYLEFFRLIQ